MWKFIHRLLLRLGYRLPARLQRPFHRFLYDASLNTTGSVVLPAIQEDGRVVRFEFVGGCRDGEVLEGNLANPFYWASEHGTVGHRFSVASDLAVDAMLNGEPTGPILKHEYEVVEKRTIGGITYVRAEARM